VGSGVGSASGSAQLHRCVDAECVCVWGGGIVGRWGHLFDIRICAYTTYGQHLAAPVNGANVHDVLAAGKVGIVLACIG
jgi:hypothetical protein